MNELESLRLVVESKRDSRGYVRVQGEAKTRIVAYLKHRRESGATVESVAGELGVSKTSLERWYRGRSMGRGPTRRMRAVTVAPQPSSWILRGPCGVTVEGMDVDALSELLRRLS